MKNTLSGKYFAAANSYGGFISYFNNVFNSNNFESIYVLKGGPGTGKSSFMKKLCEYFSDKNTTVEEIYCSSDPNSYDGLIVHRNGKSIAVIDGTAPHERDAVIPGAVDSIINLGESLDKKWLRAKRDSILKLVKEKSDAYRTAYFYLSIAGVAAAEINRKESESYLRKKSITRAKSLAESIAIGRDGFVFTRLISSFGKHGLYSLDTLNKISETQYSISGSEGCQRLFMSNLKDALIELSANAVFLPSPLLPSSLDAIYLPDERISITLGGGSEIINASEFLEINIIDEEQLRVANDIRSTALNEAKRWFGIAADMHFRLEEIYGEAMNFERNDEMFDKCLNEINETFNT